MSLEPGSGLRLGVLLLDFDGYVGTECSSSPDDTEGLGVQPVGFLEHPGSWGCDTIFRVAEGCTPEASAAATQGAARGLSEAARALDGRVDLITTDCAYTSFAVGAFDGVKTPVMPGSLAILDFVRALYGEAVILASSGETLLGVMGNPPPGVRVIGLEAKPEWARYQVFTFDMPPLDRQAMGRQVLERLEEDFSKNGAPGALILECTGLPQFRMAIREIYQGSVIDVSSLVHYLLDIEQPARAQVQLG